MNNIERSRSTFLTSGLKWILLVVVITAFRQTDPLEFMKDRLFPAVDSIAVQQLPADTLRTCLQGDVGSLLLVQYGGPGKETLALVDRSRLKSIKPIMLSTSSDKYLLETKKAEKLGGMPGQASLVVEIEKDTILGLLITHSKMLESDDLYLWSDKGAKEFKQTDLSCRTPNEERSLWFTVVLSLVAILVVCITLPRVELTAIQDKGEGENGDFQAKGVEADDDAS